MNETLLMAAAGDPIPKPVEITPEYKAEWNKFLDFLNTKGYRGNKELDKRDTNLGKQLMEEYLKTNPKTVLKYDLIKPIQKTIMGDWELAKKIQQLQGVKAENLDNRPLSSDDGWLGSMTSNGYFPTATTTDDKGQVVKDWGFDLNGYYQSLLNQQVKKVPMNQYSRK